MSWWDVILVAGVAYITVAAGVYWRSWTWTDEWDAEGLLRRDDKEGVAPVFTRIAISILWPWFLWPSS